MTIITFQSRNIIMSNSRKEIYRLCLSLVFLITPLLFVFAAPAAGRARAKQVLRIIYGGNLLGTIKPCG